MVVPDFKKSNGKWAGATTIAGKPVHTVGGRYWHPMVARCRAGGPYQQLKPSYVGVEHKFVDCHDFIEWARLQTGYGQPGYVLDKDLLSGASKVYSKETCVFLPARVNALLLKNEGKRGELPIGVHYEADRDKYTATCKTGNGRRKRLGSFNCPYKAFDAYKAFKEATIRAVAEEVQQSIDPRAFAALMKYEVHIDD